MRNIKRILSKDDNDLLMLRLVWSSISMEDYTNYLQAAMYERKELQDYLPATLELENYLASPTAKN